MTGIRIGSIIAVLCGPLLSAVPAYAQSKPDLTVQGLYQMCAPSAGAFDRTVCFGYISGIGDYMYFIGTERINLEFGICGSPAPSYGAMIRTFQNWAEKHPELGQEARQIGVGSALREIWPCTSP
jgi:hypothetical protein